MGTLFRRFLLPKVPNCIITADDFKFTLYLPASDYYHASEMMCGTYEADTVRILLPLLRPGTSMVDLGAHVGYFSLIAARRVGPLGRVYAFEPQPDVYDLLVRNIEANGLKDIVRPARKAVSDSTGLGNLFQGRRDRAEASFHSTVGGGTAETITVETTTLDAFLEAEGWPTVQLVKMDIEGAEKAALEGMREVATRNPDLRLVMEFSPGTQRAAGVAPEILFEMLIGLGFRKLWAIRNNLRSLSIPEDIADLVRVAGDGYVNLMCER